MIPLSFYFKLLNRFYRLGLWRRLANLSADALPIPPALVLSFDCDTDQDIKVAWDVHSRLMDMGVMPTYAVPGELLIRGEKVYQKIFNTGAEFINHGGREHTYFDKDLARHASCFFYDQQTQDTLRKDIVLGHKTLQNVLGITPKGFRTPHFGTFQRADHLSFLYGVLKDLNYLFSTSTSPLKGYIYGPVYRELGIYEIPVTGVFEEPMNILDTWAYFAAPDRTKSYQEYLESCAAIAHFVSQNTFLINIYGDPSHVHNQEEFFQGIKCLTDVAKNTNFEQLLGMINGNIRSL